jgi:magnesium transporter
MLRQLSTKGLTWIDGIDLPEKKIEEILESYDFHELDIEAALEPNQRARIDSYTNYIFITLHFPKYNQLQKTYNLNEFHVFVGKDFIITLRDFEGKYIDDIFEKYEKKQEAEYDLDISPGLVLYEIIQAMLEKMFQVALNIRKDIRVIEQKVFQKPTSPLVRDILIKKRNIIVLKHMFQPQMGVLIALENHMKKLFDANIEAYFEDLEDKMQKIVTDILILEEQVISVEDAFKSMIDIQSNSIIKFLTIFSAFMLPLTLITSFYGMNIDLPYQDSPHIAFISMIVSVVILAVIFLLVQKKRKI